MKKLFLLPIVLTSLTLVWLFVPKHTELNKYSLNNFSLINSSLTDSATIVFGGDAMLGRTVMTTSLEKADPRYPFLKIGDYLRNAEVTFVNLENPVVTDCPESIEGLTFCSSPRMLDGLKFAGVDVVSLANNHTLNHGKDGFGETKEHLKKAGIEYTGANNLVVKEINGTRFGFLAFEKSQQANPKLTEEERNLILDSNSKVDVLIISMHWGVEYQDKALPGVRNLAKELVDLGADVVVGHHPHWVQDYELIDGKPVYYSLGNLVFDQMWSEKTRSGLLVKLTYKDGEVVSEELVNTYMEEWAQPMIK